MARNKHFARDREPLRGIRTLRLNHDTINGPLSLFNPTKAVYDYVGVELTTANEATQYTEDALRAESVLYGTHSRQLAASDVVYSWTSRSNRKGRHSLVIRQHVSEYITPPTSISTRGIVRGMLRMLTKFPLSDISFIVGIVFTLGCCVLLVNAALTFLPYLFEWTLPPSIIYVQGGLSVLSCCLFLIGSICAYLEAVNDNRQGCFGWKIEQAAYSESLAWEVEKGTGLHVVPDEEGCTHFHSSRTNLVQSEQDLTVNVTEKETHEAQSKSTAAANNQPWRVFPSYHEFRTHYMFELGFMANAIFVFSSIIFSSCSVAALVSIVKYNDIIRWIRYPQLLGGVGFFVGSTMLMLETQKVWWKPAIRTLGWHINVWNLIGSAGFIFCAIFGLLKDTYWAKYQFGCSFLWSSWAFLFGSVVQWYESLDKHPVKKMKEGKAKGEKEQSH